MCYSQENHPCNWLGSQQSGAPVALEDWLLLLRLLAAAEPGSGLGLAVTLPSTDPSPIVDLLQGLHPVVVELLLQPELQLLSLLLQDCSWWI